MKTINYDIKSVKNKNLFKKSRIRTVGGKN